MRDEAVAAPTIIINRMSNDRGMYMPDGNYIAIRASGDVTEDEIIYDILHETDHWAQFAFLDDDEMRKTIMRYREFKPEKHKREHAPFIERINRYKSVGWGFEKD
jgi:hypothetical protein